MKYEVLDESALSTDFTFGFELEALAPTKVLNMDYDTIGDEESRNEYLLDYINSWMPNPTGGQAEVTVDESVKQEYGASNDYPDVNEEDEDSYYDNTDWPFEYSSAYYQLTPNNLGKVIHALYGLLKRGFYTNSTCGFHHHIKFKDMTEKDIIWIYCNICADMSFNKKYDVFVTGGIDEKQWLNLSGEEQSKHDLYLFRDSQYASTNSMLAIADALLDKDYLTILKNLTDEKRRAFRIHPQGTLEWRGPRNFLKKENIDIIKEFYRTFYQLAFNIKKYMDSDFIVGTHITREDLFSGLDAVKSKNRLAQLSGAEYIGTDNPGTDSKFKKEKRGLTDYGLSQIEQGVEKNNHILPIILKDMKLKPDTSHNYERFFDDVLYSLLKYDNWNKEEKEIIYKYLKDNYSLYYTDRRFLYQITGMEIGEFVEYMGDAFVRKGMADAEKLVDIVHIITRLEKLKIKHFSLTELAQWMRVGVYADEQTFEYKHSSLTEYCYGRFDVLYGKAVDMKLMCMIASLMDNKGVVQDWSEFAVDVLYRRISGNGTNAIKVWNNLMTELSKRHKEWKNFIFDNLKESFEKTLTEAVSDLKQFFKNVPDDVFQKVLRLDPTYTGGDKVGSYATWILHLVSNNLKNIEMQKQWNELLKKYPDGINPKTNKPFIKPVMLPELKNEDLYKVPEVLKGYNMYKKQIGKNINEFKTLPELTQAVESVKDTGVPQNEKALKRYGLFKKAYKFGMIPVYEDNQFVVGVPATLQSSTVFGNDTHWCTTTPSGDMYRYYTSTGNLYIIMNKVTGELFQFHFESESFMDEFDHRIDINEFTEKYTKLCEAIYNFKTENELSKGPQNKILETIELYKECLKNPEKMQEEAFYEPDCKNIKIDGGYIYGQFDFEDIGNVYHDSTRDALSKETIYNVLNGDDYGYWSDTSLDNYTSTIEEVWDKYSDKFGITQSWEDIIELSKENEDLEDLINDDFYDGSGLDSVIHWAEENGYNNALREYIVDTLVDYLPLDYKNPNEGSLLNIKIPVDKFWDVFLRLKIHYDDLPDWAEDATNYKEYQPKLNISSVEIPKFNKEDWIYDCKNEESGDTYFDENWLKQYRRLYYDGVYEEYDFYITDRNNGYYDDFDYKLLDEAFEDAMPRIKKILDNIENKE